jgi:Acetoacetate decarboxylase (ADC)
VSFKFIEPNVNGSHPASRGSFNEGSQKLSSMPLSSPSYPRGPYRFINREYLIVTYESDPGAVREALPEPLEPDGSNYVLCKFIRMPDSAGFPAQVRIAQAIKKGTDPIGEGFVLHRTCHWENLESWQAERQNKGSLDHVGHYTSRSTASCPAACGATRRRWWLRYREGKARSLFFHLILPWPALPNLPHATW